MQPSDIENTIYGAFTKQSKQRLDLTYDYETAAIGAFREIAKFLNCTTVVDVGANIGVYAVYTGSLECVRQVHAFEPSPAAFDLLNVNLGLQPGADRLHAHRIAASDRSGEVNFQVVSPLAGNSQITDCEGSIKVRCEAIDSVLHISGERIAVKVDVEGHELQALLGMKTLLSSNECYIQVECLDDHRRNLVAEALRGIGYLLLFSLRDDHLFVPASIGEQGADVLQIVSKHVSADLRSLRHLREEKRALAREAKQLWGRIGYKRDPLLA